MKKRLLSMAMALVLCLGLLPAGAFGAQSGVSVTSANFPDPVFLSRVKTLPGAEDGYLSAAELSKIKIMEFGTAGYASEREKIDDLTGIEYFTALTTLECYGNRLEHLDVSHNTKLTRLDCGYNRLSVLDVSRNTALEALFCDYNSLTQLDLSRNSALVQLYCVGNNLEQLDVSRNSKLATLDCSGNQLVELNVSQNKNMSMLWADDSVRYVENGTSQTWLGDFTPSKVLEVTGGSFEGGTINFSEREMVYTYDCGGGFTAVFTLRQPRTPHQMPGCEMVWSESFEGSAIPAVWDTEDRDGDGCNWFVYRQELPSDQIHHGISVLCSRSFDINSFESPELTPDNWLYTPAFTPVKGSKLSFDLISMNGNSAQEKLGVYVVEGRKAPVQLNTDYTSTEHWQEITLDLSDYAGKSIKVAFVHHNVTNQFALCLDCITLWRPAGSKPDPQPPLSNPFTDIREGDYFYTPALWAADRGITSGATDTEFGPALDCTRAQIVTFLWSAAGKPEPSGSANPFRDVHQNDWYYKAVLWASEKGVTRGLSEQEFGPNQVCNRAQAVTFLWTYLGKPYSKGKIDFRDTAESDWYYAPVRWAAVNGITAGMGDGTFGAGADCLRAQIVTFLYKALEL